MPRCGSASRRRRSAPRRSPPSPRTMPRPRRKRWRSRRVAEHRAVNLALQGGGTHGAFTWGVLDRLLEDGRLVIDGISGTSAGAINGALLVQGYHQGGTAGARAALDRFWYRLSELGWLSPVHRGLVERLAGSWNLDDSPSSIVIDQL